MPLDAVLNRRLLIISGKGGVGKTTVAAALGILAARHDRRVLIAEVEGKTALSAFFGAPALTSEPSELQPGLSAMNISPEEALREYFEVQFHMKRIARPLVSSQLVYYVTHAAPGLRDILMLGKVWYAATREREFDLFILDTPAAGHAVQMLRSPEGFLQAVPIGPLAGHARKVIGWLRDPREVAVHLVTIPEEMPVNETVKTARELDEQLRLQISRVYVNMLFPPVADDPGLANRFEGIGDPDGLAAEASGAGGSLSTEATGALWECGEFYTGRRALQQDHRRSLEHSLGDRAPIVDLPFVFDETFGAKELGYLADVLEEGLGR